MTENGWEDMYHKPWDYKCICTFCVLMQAEGPNHAQNKFILTLFYTIQQILYFQLSKEFTAFQRVYSYMKQKNATDDKEKN